MLNWFKSSKKTSSNDTKFVDLCSNKFDHLYQRNFSLVFKHRSISIEESENLTLCVKSCVKSNDRLIVTFNHLSASNILQIIDKLYNHNSGIFISLCSFTNSGEVCDVVSHNYIIDNYTSDFKVGSNEILTTTVQFKLRDWYTL